MYRCLLSCLFSFGNLDETRGKESNTVHYKVTVCQSSPSLFLSWRLSVFQKHGQTNPYRVKRKTNPLSSRSGSIIQTCKAVWPWPISHMLFKKTRCIKYRVISKGPLSFNFNCYHGITDNKAICVSTDHDYIWLHSFTIKPFTCTETFTLKPPKAILNMTFTPRFLKLTESLTIKSSESVINITRKNIGVGCTIFTQKLL